MEQLQINDIWHGKEGTLYENVSATIQAVTSRNVQVSFNHVIAVDGLQLAGTVMTQKQFRLNFDPGQQLSLWPINSQ
jgi:FKBP-type peptidyl-prolyl cis-trans isomerase 2